jgi:hypothetical protein
MALADPDGQAPLTGSHFQALARLAAGLPVAELVQLIEGRASVDVDIDLAERAAALFAAAFPAAAITAGEIELALTALKYLLDAAGVGGNPFVITGGVPAAFPPGGGPGSYRGR